MDPWLILTVAGALIAPALFWVGYVLRFKDTHQREPLRGIGEAYLGGLVAAWLGVHGYAALDALGLPDDPLVLLDTRPAFFWAYALGVIGPLEELAKLVPFALVLRLRRPYFNETSDGIVYSSVVALGFATYENLFYLPTLFGFEFVARAFASPLVHTVFASIWGHWIARDYVRRRPWLGSAVRGCVTAALCHGLFDVFTLQPQLRLGAAAIAFALWLWGARRIDRMRARRRGDAVTGETER